MKTNNVSKPSAQRLFSNMLHLDSRLRALGPEGVQQSGLMSPCGCQSGPPRPAPVPDVAVRYLADAPTPTSTAAAAAAADSIRGDEGGESVRHIRLGHVPRALARRSDATRDSGLGDGVIMYLWWR